MSSNIWGPQSEPGGTPKGEVRDLSLHRHCLWAQFVFRIYLWYCYLTQGLVTVRDLGIFVAAFVLFLFV